QFACPSPKLRPTRFATIHRRCSYDRLRNGRRLCSASPRSGSWPSWASGACRFAQGKEVQLGGGTEDGRGGGMLGDVEVEDTAAGGGEHERDDDGGATGGWAGD